MKSSESRERTLGGIALILFGILALVAQFVDLGTTLRMLILPALGLIFLAWGLITRESGWLIPGGIISAIGLATLLITGPFQNASGGVQGGIFMLVFAGGWFLIPILSTTFTDEDHWWALIPAAIMAVVGAGLLLSGMMRTVLAVLGQIWPLFLILLGLYLLFRRATGNKGA